MYEDIRSNKIKTGIIVSLFIIAVTLIVYYIGIAFDLGPISIVIALVFSCASAFISYYNSDKIILAVAGARPATAQENAKLVNILDNLVVSSGLMHTPKLYIQEDRQPNAFATGRNPEHSVICVTTGLLERMDYYELEAVVAHELGHIKNYDILLSCVVSVMVGLIVMLSDMFSRRFLFRKSSKDNDKSGGIMMLVGLLLLVLSPIFAKLMQLAISRKREFLADATSVGLTRNPDAMISALEKLSGDRSEMRNANKATAAMYISEPFKKAKGNGRDLFSTHPSIDARIGAIRKLK